MTGPETHCRKMCRCTIAAAAIVCGAGAIAQGQAGAQEPAQAAPFRIPVEVNRTLIPVVVRDRSGHVVEGLTQQDFQVLDNGKPGKVVGFLTEKSQTVGEASDSVAGNATAPQQTVRTAQPVTPGYIVLVFDNMHASPEYLVWAKQAAAKLLAGPMLDTNYVAIFSLSGSVHTGLTRDRGELEKALKSVQGVYIRRPGSDSCPMDYYEAYQYLAGDPDVVQEINIKEECPPPKAEAAAHLVLLEGRMDADRSLKRIEQIAHAMAHLPGRRLLVLASPGYFAGASQDVYTQSQVIDMANAAGVTISALNTRGLSSEDFHDYPGEHVPVSRTVFASEMVSDEDVMSDLTYGTGGTLFHNSNNIGAEFERLTEAPYCIYVLELSLDGVEQNGSFHTLKVKVDRDGLQVQARRGYSAPNKKGKHRRAN